ncbi:hypothetical protein F5144DRAFT_626005 [Chaetomium tenue]|uniref:Uncharacterized protein n=1 Tax=Chaetomium tenue TaxID=1854479 RepID=A0ACB7PPK7_9PEZI|nr:hypothetical protein F5144DRAFT_626005 [Chaetomium globosum]
MAAQPRFFIVRPDTERVDADGKTYIIPGPLVPLVAVDELPEWLDIPSVPRNLSIAQTMNLSNLGIASKSKDPYAVRIVHHATPLALQRAAAANNAVVAPATQPLSLTPASASNDRKATATPATPTAKPAAHRVGRTQAHQDEAHTDAVSTSTTTASVHNPQPPPPQTQPKHAAITNTNTTPANNTAIASSSSANNTVAKTEYCRHWCRYGNCRWGMRCRYLHAVPTTAAELAAIGLREIPAWWRTVAAGVRANTTPVAGLHPHQHHQQFHQDHHHHQQQQQEHYYHQHQYHQHQYPQHQFHQHHHPQHQYPQHAHPSRYHHPNIYDNHHSQGYHPDQPDPGAAAAGSTGSDRALDPRDIRFAAALQLPLRRAQDHGHTHPAHTGDVSGGAGASGPGASSPGPGTGGSAAVAAVVGARDRSRRAQFREAVALPRELGFGAGGGGGGGGGAGAGHARQRRKGGREINPLQRVHGNGVANRGVVVGRPEEELVAASVAAAAAGGDGGQVQDAIAAELEPEPEPEPVQGDGADGGGEEGEEVSGGIVQPVVAAEDVEKLVDV